jgi:hypothetical protein
MSDPYSPLEKCRREFSEDVAKIRVEAYAEAVAREAKETDAELLNRFAMAALTGLLANGENNKFFVDSDYAEQAFFHARRMMKELGK